MKHNVTLPAALALLQSAASHHRHTAELVRATGEHFNIFKILKVDRLEVKTHSPLLGELLDPRGSHGQGPVFLRHFLGRSSISDFDANTARVTLEKYAGPVTEKSGGRIDVAISDGHGHTIVIENKIDARYQDKQLQRYQHHYPQAELFYLTLDGSDPPGMTDKELDNLRFRCLSYASHILPWLEDCRREAACVPVVRELLTHYIHLVLELTNQSTFGRMNEELVSQIIGSPDNLSAFFHLREMQGAVEKALLQRLDTQLDHVASSLGLERSGRCEGMGGKETGFYFTSPDLKSSNLRFGFEFEKAWYQGLFFGFCRIQDQASPIEGLVAEGFRQMFELGTPSQWWPAWAWFDEPFRHWRAEAFEGLRSGAFAEQVETRLKAMLEIARAALHDISTNQPHS